MDPRWRRWRTSWRKLPLLSLSHLFHNYFPNSPQTCTPVGPPHLKLSSLLQIATSPSSLLYTPTRLLYSFANVRFYTLLAYDFEKCKNQTKYAFTLEELEILTEMLLCNELFWQPFEYLQKYGREGTEGALLQWIWQMFMVGRSVCDRQHLSSFCSRSVVEPAKQLLNFWTKNLCKLNICKISPILIGAHLNCKDCELLPKISF